MAMAILVLSVVPGVFAISVGTGAGLDITPTDDGPHIWECDSRAVTDDSISTGRDGTGLTERITNYAFEGEQVQWDVLVMDKNGIHQIDDVVGTIGATQGTGNDIEVTCVEDTTFAGIPASCNAVIDDEVVVFDANTQAMYTCTLTVEDPVSMLPGEYFVTVEAIEDDGDSATVAENEFWFFNPTIALAIDGTIDFSDVEPGTLSYSETLTIENDADADSGVLLDMFITGTDFYDPASVGALCPTSNRLKLGDNTLVDSDNGPADAGDVADDTCSIDTSSDNADHICYRASSGAYSTLSDPRADVEGYVPVEYADTFREDFYNDAEIIAPTGAPGGGIATFGGVDYFAGNVLTPGAEVAVTFKLGLPEPCVGDFSEGDIYFWGEAI